MRRFRKMKHAARDIAIESIKDLFKQAESTKHQPYAKRYVELARKISRKHKVRIPLASKRMFCKHCGVYLRPGKNLRIRLNKGKKTYFCKTCKTFVRVPYKAK